MNDLGDSISGRAVLAGAFRTYAAHAGTLLWGSLLVIGVASVISGALVAAGPGPAIAAIVIGQAAVVLYTGFVVRLVEDVREGVRDRPVSELFGRAAGAWPTLLLDGVLVSLGVLIGFFALIVPGLFLITIWAVVAPAIVIEGRGAMEAFRRSRELVHGHGWQVLGAVFPAFLFVTVAGFLVRAVTGAGGAGLQIADVIVATVVTEPIPALVASLLYFELRGSKGPALPDGLEEEHGGGGGDVE